MPTFDLKDYYEAHKADEKEYVHIAVARFVTTGDVFFQGPPASCFSAPALEDGYEIQDYGTYEYYFDTVQEFKALETPAADLSPAVPRRNLSDDERRGMKKVEALKSLSYKTPTGADDMVFADQDGVLLPRGRGYVFVSNFELAATFNDVAESDDKEKKLVIIDRSLPPCRGIILKEDISFTLNGDVYDAPAGSFLFPDAEETGGYSIELLTFPNAVLRQTPEQDSADSHAAAVENQEHLKKIAPRFKLK